ncbi:MAG: acetyl-CoA acetyltransferase [Deltaproteobacteria bacterium]|nr:acetyl-CoA acetyltransferase [Deltaproteobacteria bacterium]MBW2415467.1 acetyl-CoA acetyltransferase [Deltaproteobacteria bacterium]
MAAARAGRGAVLVGAGQVRNRPGLDGPFDPQEPGRLMATAVRRAVEDAGVPDLLEDADLVATVAPIILRYADTPEALVRFLGTGPKAGLEAVPGGDSPCSLLNEVANRIREGEVRIALLAGAEAVHSKRRARKEGVDLDWTPNAKDKKVMGDQRFIANEIEMRHGIFAPIQSYPLFENALRAHAGRSIEEHQVFVSEFMARYSEVAARNPVSWFPDPRTAEEIREVGPKNRWICFPYTKLMNAIIEVDQGAALVVMSEDEADRRGIAENARVAYLGGAKAADAWTPTERVDFVSSPAYRAASKRALELSGTDLSQVDAFDLYSCFPSAVELAASELGISLDDPRGLTLTGGLAHHGGPGNNYAMHSLANAFNWTRGASRTAYVSGLGMAMTKHSASVLSSDRERIAAAERRSEVLDISPELVTGPELADQPDGPGTIETYTVEFERDGTPARGIVVVRLDDGRRTVAHVEPRPEVFARLLETEAVGLRGRASAGADQPNGFALD